MILSSERAHPFLTQYSSLLLSLLDPDSTQNLDLPQALVLGRTHLLEDPSRLEQAMSKVGELNLALDPEVIEAVKTLKVDQWIYLKDTQRYSVFLDSEGEAAYGVWGLTERIRDIVGNSGCVLQAGILRYADHYVCDGLITSLVFLGKNNLNHFKELYQELRHSQRFWV
jgi:hypothetical protein